MTDAAVNATLFGRMKGAAILDVNTYEDVEADESATAQAALVVGIVAVCQGLGSYGLGIQTMASALAVSLLGWLVWAGITYLIGAKLFGGTATWGELMRTIGFAQSPGVLAVFTIVPVVGWLVRPLLFVWMLSAGVIAIRQALDFGTGKAIATALLGILPYVIVMSLLF